jgi:hypothetical protein
VSDNLPDRSVHRASDADREAVVERLRSAAEEGRLDLAEFEERMASAYQAKTYGELAPLTADLPENATLKPPDEVTLRAVGTSLRRTGRWTVPRRLVLDGKMGSTKLDFTKATIAAPEVEVALDVRAGSVVIVVPPDIDVDANEVRNAFGTVKVPSNQPATPRIRLRLTGQAQMGTVKVRYPNFWDRLLERFGLA